MKKWKRNCKKYWICVKNNNFFFSVALKFISLDEFFPYFTKSSTSFIFYRTTQISSILWHYSNALSREQCWLQQVIFTLFDDSEIILRQNQVISLDELSSTLQNSLQVHILLKYSNFNDTVALFKCIIKRTMLTLTDNVHSIRKFKVYRKSKSWWKLVQWDQRTLQATEQWLCSSV